MCKCSQFNFSVLILQFNKVFCSLLFFCNNIVINLSSSLSRRIKYICHRCDVSLFETLKCFVLCSFYKYKLMLPETENSKLIFYTLQIWEKCSIVISNNFSWLFLLQRRGKLTLCKAYSDGSYSASVRPLHTLCMTLTLPYTVWMFHTSEALHRHVSKSWGRTSIAAPLLRTGYVL